MKYGFRNIVQCSIIWLSSLALLLLSGCATGDPEREETPWVPVARILPDEPGADDFRRLVSAYPDSGSARLRLMNALLDEQPEEAVLHALALVRQGYHFSPAAMDVLSGLDPVNEPMALQAANAQTGRTVAASEPFAVVPAEARLVENVWRDPRNGDLFATAVVSRNLFVRRGDGDWHELPIAGAGSLTGMGWDAGRQWLWIASGVVEQTPDPEDAFRGLVAMEPRSGAELARIGAPASAHLSDILVASDGSVFASDPLSGAVYVADGGEGPLAEFIPQGILRSPQGIAELPSGDLVISDYRYGLALLKRDSREVLRIDGAGDVLLDGIDALAMHDGELVAVQNGTSPMRIVRFPVSGSGSRLGEATILEQAHPAWTEPLGANVDGDRLIYVANGQWNRFGAGGVSSGEAQAEPTEIRALPLVP